MKIKAGLVLGLLASTYTWADIPRTGGSHPTITIQKLCEGDSVDEAKRSCLSSAIEQVVGQVIVSDLEVSGDRITKDNIGQYSAGYIDDYVIQQQTQDEFGQWHLKMSVTVASSKIAQRKLSRGEHTDFINGEQAQTQIESQVDQRNRGDALITQVLSSYPENAYVINSGSTEFKITNLRQPYVEVPYTITMSRPWLEAFDEALDIVAVNSAKCNTLSMVVADGISSSRTSGQGMKKLANGVCGSDPDIRVFYKSGFFPKSNGYYFADAETLHAINNELHPSLGQQHIGLRVDLLDAGGNIIDSRCAKINNELFVQYSKPTGTYNLRDLHKDSRPNVMGQNNVYGTLRVSINNTQQLEDLVKVKLNIQRTCT